MNIKLSLVAALLVLIFGMSDCNQKEKQENVYLNHDTAVHYVGIQACKSCHYDKFTTFLETGMGSSFGDAHLKRSSAHFQNVIPVYDSFRNFYYLPFTLDSLIYLKEYRMDGKDTVYSRTERISYIVGSGHHTNSHMIEENGYVFQAPLTFYTQKGQWDLPPGFENGLNSRFSRKIGLECMSCHNATPVQYSSGLNRFAELPHGIDCERCHGPGSLHVEQKSNGKIVDVNKEVDYTIVNPAKLSWQRQIDVCQRCHLQGNAVLKPGKEYTDFRPGMRLSEVFDQFSPYYENGEDFVMAAHAERFQQSKCFKSNVSGTGEQIKAAFTCISCHNPHVSVRQTNVKTFNNVCSSCHIESKNDCSLNIREREAKKNNCVACHMPGSGTSDIPHVSVHDHYIRKPQPLSKDKSQELKLVGLRCITNPNPDILTETMAYITYFEKFDQNSLYLNKAKEKIKELDTDKKEFKPALVHLYYVSSEFDKIISLNVPKEDVEDAWTAYRISRSYTNQSKYAEALEWMQLALKYQKDHLDFRLQEGTLLLRLQDYKKLETRMTELVHLYSKVSEAYALKGVALLKQNNLKDAKLNLESALKLDPDQILALTYLIELEKLLGNQVKLEDYQKRLTIIRNKNVSNPEL